MRVRKNYRLKGRAQHIRAYKKLLAVFAGASVMIIFLLSAVWLMMPDAVRADLSDNLVGEWKLDEGSGTTVADSSANGNDGTIVQGTGTGSPAWVSPGHNGTGSALEFDGTGTQGAAANSVNVGNSAVMDQMDNYTISVWVKFEPGYVGGGGGAFANLVGRNSSGADWAWMLYVQSNGTLRPHHKNSNGTYVLQDSATVIPTGEWVHIEQIANNGNLHLYINGQEDPNFPVAYSGTTFSLPDANVWIGQDAREAAPLATISEVSIYNAAVTAPGGVREGLSTWQRADDGSATGALWGDSSGNGNDATQGTAASQPTPQANGINFNPALSFDGNDFINYASDLGISGTNNFSTFSVTQMDSYPTNQFVHGATTGSNLKHELAINNLGQVYVAVGGAGGDCFAATSTMLPASTAGVESVVRSDGDSVNVKLNGGGEGTGVCTANFNALNRQLGARQGQNPITGFLPEFIQYDRTLTASEINRIESYLAIKYGVTIDQTAPQNYLASDGATTPWNATEGGAYNHDIAGIGRDDAGSLSQKQSLSVNNDAFVTIGNGSIEATNQQNVNDFASDLTFMMWGNDDSSTDVVNDVVPVGGTQLKRMERAWKMQETGTVGTVKLQIPQAELSGTSPTLLVSGDATFDSTDTQIALTTNGANYEADVNYTDGQFFTFGVDMVAPEVTTDPADIITQDSAIIHGTLDALGNFTDADVFFRYRVVGSGDPFTETTPQTLNASGTFDAPISGLTLDTQYEFKTVVQWQAGGTQESEGSLLSFVTDPAVAPNAPTNLQAVSAGVSQINLSWDAPADEGGSPITGYRIERSLTGVDGWTTVVGNTGSTSTTYPNTGLDSDTEYFYRISAINSAGTGNPSNVASATTDAIPQGATDAATDITQDAAMLHGSLDSLGDFTPVNALFRYRVQGSGDPFTETSPQQLTVPGAFSQNLTGLDPSTTYEYKAVVQWEDGGTQEAEGSLVTLTTFADDGTPACVENNVDCFVSPISGKNVKLVVDDACTINTAGMKPQENMSVADPDGFSYPLGLMDFNIDCGTPGYTATIIQYYYDAANDNYILRKHNPDTEAYFTIQGAIVTQTTLGGQTVTTATYQITDGGELDVDGTANGTIVDPAGLALGQDDSNLAETGQNVLIPVSIASLFIAVSIGVIFKRKMIDATER